MWFKGGWGWSWTWPWRARRGERRRCSSGCKRAEKCSSKQKAPPRPRPAPRCLFSYNILKRMWRKKLSGIWWGLQNLNCWVARPVVNLFLRLPHCFTFLSACYCRSCSEIQTRSLQHCWCAFQVICIIKRYSHSWKICLILFQMNQLCSWKFTVK